MFLLYEIKDIEQKLFFYFAINSLNLKEIVFPQSQYLWSLRRFQAHQWKDSVSIVDVSVNFKNFKILNYHY